MIEKVAATEAGARAIICKVKYEGRYVLLPWAWVQYIEGRPRKGSAAVREHRPLSTTQCGFFDVWLALAGAACLTLPDVRGLWVPQSNSCRRN